MSDSRATQPQEQLLTDHRDPEVTILGPLQVVTVVTTKALLISEMKEALHANRAISKQRLEAIRLISVSDKAWTAIDLSCQKDFSTLIASAVSGSGYVSDQTGGYAFLNIRGKNARKVIAQGMSVDLSPFAFPVRHSVSALMNDVGVIAWLEDEQPSFYLGIPRSYKTSFITWLISAARNARHI